MKMTRAAAGLNKEVKLMLLVLNIDIHCDTRQQERQDKTTLRRQAARSKGRVMWRTTSHIQAATPKTSGDAHQEKYTLEIKTE